MRSHEREDFLYGPAAVDSERFSFLREVVDDGHGAGCVRLQPLSHLDSIRFDWIWMGFGLHWIGLEWSGVEWRGVGRTTPDACAGAARRRSLDGRHSVHVLQPGVEVLLRAREAVNQEALFPRRDHGIAEQLNGDA
eukprot:scaffold1185_cov238-Pinguiococcus_pyrenoidosus.AAC.3